MTYIKYKSGRNSTASALKAVINYCLQPYKTEVGEQVYCTAGQDCTPSLAYKQFMATKAAFGKTDGVSFYHYVQSFSPEEHVTPEEANKIALELAEEWKGHEVLVATHVDRAHIHSHLIINSVNFETGLKLRQSPKTLEQLRKRSDEICIAHGLSILKPYEKGKVSGVKTGEYRTAFRGDSWKFRLASAINQAMNLSWTKEQFIANMHRLGYDVRWTDERKNITYTCLCEPKFKDGSYRKCRDNKLHEEKYLKENMEDEFYERAKLYTETIATGAVKSKFTADCSGAETANGNGDFHGGLEQNSEGVQRFMEADESDSKTDERLERLLTETTKALEQTVRQEVKTALETQKTETKQTLKAIADTAEEQVGRAAERASKRIDRQAFLNDFLWWVRIILMGLPMCLVLLLWVWVSLHG